MLQNSLAAAQKEASAARNQEIAQTRNVLAAVASENTEKDEAVAREDIAIVKVTEMKKELVAAQRRAEAVEGAATQALEEANQ
jgi:hypothetical protein